MFAVRMENHYDDGGGDGAVSDSGGPGFSQDWRGDAISIGGIERVDSAFSATEREMIVSLSQESELAPGSQEAQLRGTIARVEGFQVGGSSRGGGGGGANRKSLVGLNVGGQRFETSMETLSFDSHSMLAAMVARHMRNEDDAIFIDRDPTRFRHVLNYLRSQTIWLGELSDLRAVQEEADFFNLSGLHELCEERIQEVLRVKNEQHEVLELKSLLKGMMESLKSNQQKKEPVTGFRRRRLEYESLSEPVFRMDEDF